MELSYTSQNEQTLILKALYENNINIVLKFNILKSIEKEKSIIIRYTKFYFLQAPENKPVYFFVIYYTTYY